jgi:hypothetical protein
MATWPAASTSSADVMAAIALASAGDTVTIPAGSSSWAALSVTLNKAITLQGVSTPPAAPQGSGTSSTIIDVSGTPGNSSSNVTFNITKQAGGLTHIKGIKFIATDNSGEQHPINIDGGWLTARPVIFENCEFVCSGAAMIDSHVAGGVIFSNITYTGEWNDFFLTIKDLYTDAVTYSWHTADSMGMNDTTGEKNIYIENSRFNGGANGVVDADDNCRIVDRSNLYVRSGGFNSHGWDTSPYGCRHFEIYNNTYTFPIDPANSNAGTFQKPYRDGGSYSNNVNFYMWLRGGTGVIFNNDFANLFSVWGQKFMLSATIRGIEDNIGGSNSPFPGGCGTVAYPCPHQLGQNNNGSADFTDPIYVWGNTGTLWHPTYPSIWGSSSFGTWGNQCGLPDYNVFWQSGRDYVLSGGDGKGATGKAGYTSYTFPHPLVAAAGTPDLPPGPRQFTMA